VAAVPGRLALLDGEAPPDLMELYAKRLLDGIEAFPVAPEEAGGIVARLDVMEKMPGFYQRLLGKNKEEVLNYGSEVSS
jgi:hypothetical protein